MTHRQHVMVLIALALVAGLMAGAALMQVYFQTRLRGLMRGEQERYHEYFLRRLQAEVRLTPEQYALARAVILTNREQLLLLRQRTQPDVEQLAAQANQEILQRLTPEQAVRFKAFLVRFPEPGLRGFTATPVGAPGQTGAQRQENGASK